MRPAGGGFWLSAVSVVSPISIETLYIHHFGLLGLWWLITAFRSNYLPWGALGLPPVLVSAYLVLFLPSLGNVFLPRNPQLEESPVAWAKPVADFGKHHSTFSASGVLEGSAGVSTAIKELPATLLLAWIG